MTKIKEFFKKIFLNGLSPYLEPLGLQIKPVRTGKNRLLMIDMDGVIADFDKKLGELAPDLFLGEGDDYEERSKKVDLVCQNNCDVFHTLEPIAGAIEAVKELMKHYTVYFLSTPMYAVPKSYEGKRIWLEEHFGELAKKRLILTHRKDLVIGDYLIDDRTRNGAGEFTGKHLHFGTPDCPNWDYVLKYLV